MRMLEQGVSVRALPGLLSVSRKTITRDLADLRASGVQLASDAGASASARSAGVARRREQVARLYLLGGSVRNIARVLEVPAYTIRRDLRALAADGAVQTSPDVVSTTYATPFALARVAAGLSLGAVADASGVRLPTVAAAERGRQPHRDSAVRLADALGRAAAELWPEMSEVLAGRVGRPAVEADDDDVARRRAAVAALRDQDLTPPQIAERTGASRATVYRDIAALRAEGWQIPPRPFGRPPQPLKDTGQTAPDPNR